jgi:hypothetical protein
MTGAMTDRAVQEVQAICDAEVGWVLRFTGPIVWVTVVNIAPLIEIARVSFLDVSPPAADHVAQPCATVYSDGTLRPAPKLAQDGPPDLMMSRSRPPRRHRIRHDTLIAEFSV